MYRFKDFLKEDLLKEYLTDAQRKKYSSVKVSDAARKSTDHFFGEGNDQVREDLINYDHGKSEVHRQILLHR